MNNIVVQHAGGDRFVVSVRGHTFTVDQPADSGGEDTAATPTEVFVGSLAACVAFYTRRYLVRHELPTAGLTVSASFVAATRPNRIADIRIGVDLPVGVPVERHNAVLAVASGCTIHNTLSHAPSVSIELRDTAAAA